MDILFDTNGLIACSKPAGISSIPGKSGEPHLLSLAEEALGQKLWVVHRLDKEVSGLILFARDAGMHRHLNLQFGMRQVTKTYLAMVSGIPDKKEGYSDSPVREFGSGRMGVDRVKGKPSLTRWKVIGRSGEHSLLKVNPETGRRHQIRVHLYAAGHPVAGDRLYGRKQAQEACPRLMLHAYSLVLELPDGTPLTVTCPPPPDFKNVLADYGIRFIKSSLE